MPSKVPPAILSHELREEWAEKRKLCSWCQIATLVSAATLALTLPEAGRAARQLAKA